MNDANYSVICPGCNEVVDLRTDWVISHDHCDTCEVALASIPPQDDPTDEELAEMESYYRLEGLLR